jgi:hypothetical protein
VNRGKVLVSTSMHFGYGLEKALDKGRGRCIYIFVNDYLKQVINASSYLSIYLYHANKNIGLLPVKEMGKKMFYRLLFYVKIEKEKGNIQAYSLH